MRNSLLSTLSPFSLSSFIYTFVSTSTNHSVGSLPEPERRGYSMQHADDPLVFSTKRIGLPFNTLFPHGLRISGLLDHQGLTNLEDPSTQGMNERGRFAEQPLFDHSRLGASRLSLGSSSSSYVTPHPTMVGFQHTPLFHRYQQDLAGPKCRPRSGLFP